MEAHDPLVWKQNYPIVMLADRSDASVGPRSPRRRSLAAHHGGTPM